MQLAKAYGLRVLGTAGTTEGEEAVKQAGASEVFNHREDGYVQRIEHMCLSIHASTSQSGLQPAN